MIEEIRELEIDELKNVAGLRELKVDELDSVSGGDTCTCCNCSHITIKQVLRFFCQNGI